VHATTLLHLLACAQSFSVAYLADSVRIAGPVLIWRLANWQLLVNLRADHPCQLGTPSQQYRSVSFMYIRYCVLVLLHIDFVQNCYRDLAGV